METGLVLDKAGKGRKRESGENVDDYRLDARRATNNAHIEVA